MPSDQPEATDQRIAGAAAGQAGERWGLRAAPYQLDMFGSKSKIFDFAESRIIPIPLLHAGRLVRCWRGSSY